MLDRGIQVATLVTYCNLVIYQVYSVSVYEW
jgi:hypothetical protein